MLDFNAAETQRTREVIPADTVAVIQMNIKPGDAGEGKWLKTAKDGRSQGLECQFTLVEGEYIKRKFRSRLTLEGETDGHKDARDISRRTLRAILESARGVRPDDQSDAAKRARMADYAEFDGIRFLGRIGVEPAKNGYAAKNTLFEVITPERKNWHPIEQVATPQNGISRHPATAPPPAAEIERPAWAW
jgi:hypothetical protein